MIDLDNIDLFTVSITNGWKIQVELTESITNLVEELIGKEKFIEEIKEKLETNNINEISYKIIEIIEGELK